MKKKNLKHFKILRNQVVKSNIKYTYENTLQIILISICCNRSTKFQKKRKEKKKIRSRISNHYPRTFSHPAKNIIEIKVKKESRIQNPGWMDGIAQRRISGFRVVNSR